MLNGMLNGLKNLKMLSKVFSLPAALCLSVGSVAHAAEVYEIAANAFGGTTYQYSYAISEVIKTVAPQYELLPVETAGSPASIIKTSASPEHMICAITAVPFREAVQGKPPFPEAYPDLKIFGFVTQNIQTMITYDPKIRSLTDLKGKRIGLMSMMSSNGKYQWSVISRGIEGSKGMKPTYLNWTGLQSALLDGAVDAATLGVTTNPDGPWQPVNIYAEMVASRGAPYFLDIDPRYIEEAAEADGLRYVPVIIPKGAIAENVPDRDITAWEERCGIGGFVQIPDDLAYTIAKILCENQEDIAKYTPLGKLMSHTFTVPTEDFLPEEYIHPGALRYYKEKGLR